MAITFSCGHCGKSLTTADDKAGRKAKCPGCGEVLTVPTSEPHAEGSLDDELGDEEGALDEADGEGLPAAPPPLAKRSSASSTRNCPMCGEKNPRRAKVCEACGEKLEAEADTRRRSGGIRTDVEVGEVISDSWESFKENFGICIGAQIVGGIVIGMGFLPLIGLAIAIAVMMDNPNGPQEPPLALLLGMIPALLIGLAVACFVSPGMIKFFIGVARGDEVEILQIFQGGKYFLPFAGYSTLYFVLALLGIPALCIGYFAVIILLWPMLFIVVDREKSERGIFEQTLELSKPNWVMSLLTLLVVFGIQFLINLFAAIPCIGPIVSLASILIQPWFQVVWATAYVKMSGQEPDDYAD